MTWHLKLQPFAILQVENSALRTWLSSGDCRGCLEQIRSLCALHLATPGVLKPIGGNGVVVQAPNMHRKCTQCFRCVWSAFHNMAIKSTSYGKSLLECKPVCFLLLLAVRLCRSPLLNGGFLQKADSLSLRVPLLISKDQQVWNWGGLVPKGSPLPLMTGWSLRQCMYAYTLWYSILSSLEPGAWLHHSLGLGWSNQESSDGRNLRLALHLRVILVRYLLLNATLRI